MILVSILVLAIIPQGALAETPVFNYSGTGEMNTPPFDVSSSPWLLQFTCDWDGLFYVNINNGTSGNIINRMVSAGVVYETYIYGHTGSDLYFHVASAPANGNWNLSVFPWPITSLYIYSCDVDSNEKNQFIPGETVYVRGSGLEGNTQYNIWIQQDGVIEGAVLLPGDNPIGCRTSSPVTTSSAGILPLTAIWTIPPESVPSFTAYDIVVDEVGSGEGIYNASDDALDSAVVAGFNAPVPEYPTTILMSLGLLTLGVFIWYRRRRVTAPQ